MKTDAMATLEREIARSGVDPFPIIERWLMVEGGQEVYLPRSFRDERICRLYSEGVTICQISRMFDLSQRTVRRIVR